MDRFSDAIAIFDHAMDRARQMVKLYDALMALRPSESANDDALRSAYFQTVSSFDFFVHELAAVEARYRFVNGRRTRNIALPMEIMTIADYDDRVDAAINHLRQVNSYKAFVDPSKLAEVLSCYCESPWQKLTTLFNDGCANQRSMEEIKGQLKSIWGRRNKIAHSADVNPAMGGISLWPIDKPDTEITIEFIGELGRFLPVVFADPLNVAA